MDFLNEDPAVRLARYWNRYLIPVIALILAVPFLFYFLVVRSPAPELIYTFRISNGTDYYLKDVRVESGQEFRCAVPPNSDSELFTLKIRGHGDEWFPKGSFLVTVKHYGDSARGYLHQSETILLFSSKISPDRLNRIRIGPGTFPDFFRIEAE